MKLQSLGLTAVLSLCLLTQAGAQAPPLNGATAAAAQNAIADGKLDLSDPRIRDRLRASGIDPDELQKLMSAAGSTGATSPTSSVPSNLNPASPTDAGTAGTPFPPVTPVPGAPPVPNQAPVMGAQQMRTDSTLAKLARADSVDSDLKPFGYDLFRLTPTTFEPLAFGPVAADYLIGPGDEIIVSVWGAQELNARAVVNRDGYVILPDVGQVMANGYTLTKFKEALESRLARVYSGISRDGRGRTAVEVSLGKLRSIQVFVLGDVVQPGGYTLSATSTVMSSLYFAGGPTLRGSMREIRVVRGNQTVHQVDLYEYIARGERSQDWKLENGDVIFVPPSTRRVTLTGEIRHPAVYEMRAGETLADLLALSGGMTANAQRTRAQIERTIPFDQRDPLLHEDRKILDLSLPAGAATELIDSDIVRVFRGRDMLRNTVKIVGPAVYKSGNYQHHPGMTVADLVQQAGGLLGDAYLGWAHLVRTHDDNTRTLVSFNMDAALRRDKTANLTLQQRDEVQVFSQSDIRDPETVSIQGLVRRPGIYPLLHGMTITDLIVKAGGLQESAYRTRAEVSRIDPAAVSDGRMAELKYVSMGDSLTTDSEASNVSLEKNDIVFIREVPNWSLQENVWVTGEVKFPGMYSLTSKTERLSSVVQRAGGLDQTAYLQAATFTRKKDQTGRMAINFAQALKSKSGKPNKYDLVLAAGDSVHIPREPKAVKVTGEVGFPSSVLWEDGRDYGYYLNQAGGLLSTADKSKITVVMASGRVERPGFFHKPEPDAGATIRVPHKIEEPDRQTLKDMAQIVSILSGAATTIYLISRSH